MNHSQTGKLTLKKPVKIVWSTKTINKLRSKNPPNESESNLKNKQIQKNWKIDIEKIRQKKVKTFLKNKGCLR